MMQDFSGNRRGDGRRAIVDKFYDFGHGGNLEKPPRQSK
jgi:hypothetical protein